VRTEESEEKMYNFKMLNLENRDIFMIFLFVINNENDREITISLKNSFFFNLNFFFLQISGSHATTDLYLFIFFLLN